ncbi:hypothetical protein LTS10_007675 [Elasticomyces elasticus]|nr:hypothetical protein LTS10_007675 [Elasticomyces elasticus]
MELMHHYANVVSKEALLTREGISMIWREYIPKEALKHSFLLHGLLAFSALNLADLNRNSSEVATRYLAVCDKHQAVAIAALRDALDGNVTAENSGALFALAAIIKISSMARSCAMANARPFAHLFSIDEISEVILLGRGMREVTALTYPYVVDTPIALMFKFNAIEDSQANVVCLPAAVLSHFADLHAMLDKYHQQTPAVPSLTESNRIDDVLSWCHAALTDLESIYLNIRYWSRHGGLESGHVWRWPAMLETKFIHLISARYGPALVLVGHFAAATVCLKKAWYVRNWGVYALDGISQSLEGDEEMRRWLDWPREQIRSEMRIVLD